MTGIIRLSAPGLLLLTLLGCRDSQVQSYRVPREKDLPMPAAVTAAPQGGESMASTPVPGASGPDLLWTAPAHWQAQPPSAMRKGSFTITGTGSTGTADLSITAFPGEVGGVLANLNRWRGQIELPALTDAQAASTIEHIDANNLHFDFVDYSNPQMASPQRVLGAIVPYNNSTWFFKLSGPDALVASEKAAFMQFLRSVRTP